MRIIFFGTPQLAVPTLLAVHELGEVVQVLCQPDRPAGRGMAVQPPPVKVSALELGLPVAQPTKVRTEEFAASLRALEADVAVVVAYGRILPRAVLDATRAGAVNLHASLLPRWRGAGPIQWAILGGDHETGICLMRMDEGMDTGPVLAIERTPIDPDETAGTLGERLSRIAANVIRANLVAYVDGDLPAITQAVDGITHARMLDKDDGRIPWEDSARAVHDRVRGLHPWPVAFTKVDGVVVRIHRTRVVDTATRLAEPGEVLRADDEGIVVACGVGAVALLELQRPSKRRLSASEFLRGDPWPPGERLGVGSRR